MGELSAPLSPRSKGTFKSFLQSDKGAERMRKREVASIKASLERGSYLKEPCVEVTGEEFAAMGLVGVTGTMQGWRAANEDTAVLECGNGRVVMGVYDGHGGGDVARYLQAHLHPRLLSLPELSVDAITRVFIDVDAALAAELGARASATGATANVVLVDAATIWCANTGDCRAVLCRRGGAQALSEDHHPESPREVARIEKAGSALKQGRVDGMLNVSRAFGDHDFKKASLAAAAQAVTCVPDVTSVARVPGADEFVVQACDGIWGSLSSEQCVEHLASGGGAAPLLPSLSRLFTSVLASSAEGQSGTDNMTAGLLYLPA